MAFYDDEQHREDIGFWFLLDDLKKIWGLAAGACLFLGASLDFRSSWDKVTFTAAITAICLLLVTMLYRIMRKQKRLEHLIYTLLTEEHGPLGRVGRGVEQIRDVLNLK